MTEDQIPPQYEPQPGPVCVRCDQQIEPGSEVVYDYELDGIAHFACPEHPEPPEDES